MNTKLTLTIEQSIIKNAEKCARSRERSLSDLFENYLKASAKGSANDEDDVTPTVKSLRGSFKLPKNLNYRKEFTDRLSEKYL